MTPVFNWSWVESQSERTAAIWRDSAGRALPSGLLYSPQEQNARESTYDECIESVEQDLRRRRRISTAASAFQERFTATFAQFAVNALGLEEGAIDLISRGFLPAGIEFARRSRRFDTALSMPEIVQACRNAWTVYGLQSLFGEPSRITPAILGYSLLYPYTDNYLDRRDATPAAKRLFCARFRRRLEGDFLPVHNTHEASVWALVAMIESQYSRANYPQLYDALLAIHRAQEESVVQLGRGPIGRRPLGDDQILQISCAKGGTSVLADACLVRGWLTESESPISFDWGVLLQLGDDLQDVREDLRRGSATLFTRAIAAGYPLDSLVTQLLNFSEAVGSELENLPTGSATLKNLLRMSWRSLILAAVANLPEFFSPAFLRELEPSSPFRFAFLRARNKKMASRRGLYTTVFSALVEEPEFKQFAGDSFGISPATHPARQNDLVLCK